MSRRRLRTGGSSPLPAIAEPEKRVPRRLRLERDVHRELVVALATLADPRLASVGVTRVEMSDDLRHARVHVRHGLEAQLEGQGGRARLLSGLDAACGKLRSHIGRRLALRYTPELAFRYDEGPDAARRVDELLAEIHRDEEPDGEG